MYENARRVLTLTLSCPDRVGIVAAVSTLIARKHGWIVEANHHSDPLSGRFFMRNVIIADSLADGVEDFRREFASIAAQFHLDWSVADSAVKKRVVLLVSRLDHCLYDLLHRWKSGEYDIEIPCVISNHADLRADVESRGLEYIHIPATAANRDAACARIAEIFEQRRADVLVLARYMQILTPAMCARYPARIINIHHGFLPSFSGARPYHQALERGVKLIGATCHYVTPELDEGPIIEQDVIRIDHTDTVEDLIRYGRDIERRVLAQGLKYHLEDRVLLDGRKTVVMR